MKKIYTTIIVLLCVSIVVLIIFGKKYFDSHQVVEAKNNIVVYADGTAEIVVRDKVPDEKFHTYRAKIKLPKDEFGTYYPPHLTLRDGAWQRQAHTYNDDSINGWCEKNIFFMDRINKITKQSHIDFCISKTLDEHGVTTFLATSEDLTSLVIGNYEDGKIIASTTIPNGLKYFNSGYGDGMEITAGVSDWEITKLAFPAGECAMGDGDMRVFLWDIKKGTVEDKTPAGAGCNLFRIIYDHGKDNFYVIVTEEGKDWKEIWLK